MGVLRHPEASQVSIVQGLPSSQFGACRQTPSTQESKVHELASSQLMSVKTQPIAVSQASAVQE
jgi:hypothetical protein